MTNYMKKLMKKLMTNYMIINVPFQRAKRAIHVFSCLFVLVFSSDAVIHVVKVDRNGE